MSGKTVAVIRVVTLEDPGLLRLHGELMEAAFPGLHTVSVCIPDQPRGVCSPETEAAAVPKILEIARKLRGVDALVVSCCGDPAVEELRLELDIPVIGAGAAVCAVAGVLGRHPGVLGIMEEVPKPYQRMLGESLIHLGRPEHITCTLDLLTGAGREAVIRKALELKAHGADCLALACTGMSTIRIAEDLRRACGIPVVDPVTAEGLFAYYVTVKNAL